MRIFTAAIISLAIASCNNATEEKVNTDDKTTKLVAMNAITEEEKNDGWRLLFDGQTLNGWRSYQNRETDCWGVKDGMIYCKGDDEDKSDLRADLISEEQFENFELSIEWKIAPGGNSGIMYHVSESQSAAYLTGPEYQLIDDEGFPEKLEDWQKTGSDYAMYTATARPTKPVGEFNVTKIVVNGAKREHWLNGEKILEFEAWTDDWNKRKSEGKWKDTPTYGMEKKGHIVLQDHGSGVWFRNVKIKELK